MQRQWLMSAAAASAVLILPTMANAYVGPGMGIGAITAVLGVLAALFLAVLGLIWYPVKRMLRRRRSSAPKAGPGADN